MPHIKKIRDGWQSENFAKYILHDFTFIAEPPNIGNDIKIDFFCTFFNLKQKGEETFLYPRNSFALQVKSNDNLIDISNDIDFFNALELPYFVGVVNKEKTMISIYSGEYLQPFFSYKNLDCEIKIKLTKRTKFQNIQDCFKETKENTYQLFFPFVCEFSIDDSADEKTEKVTHLKKLNQMIMNNIAMKINGQYIFSLFDESKQEKVVLFGPGSNKVFRDNFLNSLTEAFYNLIWIKSNSPQFFNDEEYLFFKTIYEDIKKMNEYKPISALLSQGYDQLLKLINSEEKSS
jgi:hypothetical protein